VLDKVDLLAAAQALATAWVPGTVAAFNGHHVQVVRVEDAFDWHRHPQTDDLFLALDEPVQIDLRERTVTLERGELFVVPAGVEHRLRSDVTAHVLCIEHLGDGSGASARVLEAEVGG
jgi:mannose-6-phosphate isomerase-like protein (cupin superfamily)